MKATIYNDFQLQNHVKEMQKLLQEGKPINIIYEKGAKPVTHRQVGFFFAALVNQIYLYFRNSGFSLSEKQVRYGLYKQVARVVPNMVYDLSMFGQEPQIKHISDMGTAQEMSEFIDGVFTVIDTNPMYEGLKLTPDVRYNWLYHITHDDIRNAQLENYPERDNEYLDYIRSLPCIICGLQHHSDAHHLKDNRLCGISEKAPDWAAMPLCHTCHICIAHGTGFKDAMKWIKIDLIDFCRLCYQRWRVHK